jgi:hypothetical protein
VNPGQYRAFGRLVIRRRLVLVHGDNPRVRALNEIAGSREDVTMSDQTPAPGSSSDELTSEPEVMDEAREAAMMRAVMRAQEEHREGGVDPELDEATPTGPESDAET